MDTFEYRTILLKHEADAADFSSTLETTLNRAGEKGWELVSLLKNSQLGPTKYSLVGVSAYTIAIMKRKNTAA